MEEPFFLVNEFVQKDKKEIENILKVLKGPKIKNVEKAVFLRNFSNEMFKSYKNQRARFLRNEEDERKKIEILSLVKKREMLLEKLKTASKIENAEKKNVVVSKITKNTLVTSSFADGNYKINEPILNEIDSKIIENLKLINLEDVNAISNKTKELCSKFNVNYSNEYFDKIRYYLIRDVKKFGIISPLIEDNNVKEITCNGANKYLIIQYNDKTNVNTNIMFKTDEEINNFIKNLAKSKNIEIKSSSINFKINNEIEMHAVLGNETIKPKFAIVKKS